MRNFIDKHHYYFKINKHLIPIKATGFAYGISRGAIHSYLSIQAKSLGITALQLGIILSIMPAAVLLGPPIFSPLADKLQKHKLFLVIFLLLAAGLHMALTTVPKIPSSAQHQSNVTNLTDSYYESTMELSTGNDHGYNYSSDDYNQTFQIDILENSTDTGHESNYATAIIQTVIIYAVVRLLAQTCVAVAQTFLDAVNFGLINKYGGKNNKRLGMNRFWHYVGEALGSPFAGLVIDWFRTGDGKQRNFLPGFIINAGASAAAGIIVALMEVTIEVKPKEVWKNVGGLLKRPSFAIFLFAVVVIGKRWSLGTL